MVSYGLELFHRYRYSLVKRALSPWSLARFLLPSPALRLPSLSLSLYFSLFLLFSISTRLSDLSPQHANLTPAKFARTSQSSLFGKLRQRAERHGETAAFVAAGFVRIDLEFRGRVAELGEFD